MGLQCSTITPPMPRLSRTHARMAMQSNIMFLPPPCWNTAIFLRWNAVFTNLQSSAKLFSAHHKICANRNDCGASTDARAVPVSGSLGCEPIVLDLLDTPAFRNDWNIRDTGPGTGNKLLCSHNTSISWLSRPQLDHAGMPHNKRRGRITGM